MAHVRKRQFQPTNNQPSIKSFFTRIDPENPPADFDPYDRKHVPSFTVPLPEPVQSQLMNMGMRIRKSVPEGYKTHKTLPAMPPQSSMPAFKPTLIHSESAPSSSAPALYSKSNELVPMCGLHKIGGYASQPPTSSVVPSLVYSQSTLASSDLSMPVTPANTLKRSHDDEVEDELDAFFEEQKDKDSDEEAGRQASVTPSKTKYPFSHSSMPELNRKVGFVRPGSRPKARMKARMSPEKMAILNTADKDFDDTDVNFLQPMDCD